MITEISKIKITLLRQILIVFDFEGQAQIKESAECDLKNHRNQLNQLKEV